MSVNVVFTGVYRNSPNITNMSLQDRVDTIRRNGVNNIFWYTWKGQASKDIEKAGVTIREIDEPYPHIRGIEGRQRQIYNIKKALNDFDDNDIVLKLRWDLDFNDILIKNISKAGYFTKVKKGIIDNKVWTGFYSIVELFSPADKSFAGYKKDLDILINYQYSIGDIPANNYISHDGMMLMPRFIEND